MALTGLPVVASRGYELLSDGRLAGSLAGPLAAGAVLLLLVPRRRHALLATAAALLAVGWGALALRVTGVDLTPLTVGLGSLTAAVGCEFTLFTLERRAAGEERAFRGAVTAAATAAAGFAALAVSRLDVLAGFGLVLAGSVLLALLAAALLAGPPVAADSPGGLAPNPRRPPPSSRAEADGRRRRSLELDDPVRGRLVVGSGQTVVLLGPSGAGKTRLIRALLGLEEAGHEPVLSVRGRRARPRNWPPWWAGCRRGTACSCPTRSGTTSPIPPA